MGLIYEYSNTDDFSHRRRPTSTAPATVSTPDGAAEDFDFLGDATTTATADTRATPETPSPAQPTSVTGGLVGQAALVAVIAFFGLLVIAGFVLAFGFLLQNPAVLEAEDPFVAAQSLVEPFEEQIALSYLFTALVYGLALLLGAVFVVYRLGWRWDAVGGVRLLPEKLRYAITIGVAGSLTMIGTALLVGNNLSPSGSRTDTLREALAPTDPLIIGAAVIIALTLLPLGFELFFRGVFYTWMRGRNGVFYAAAITALASGFFNPNPIGFLPNVAVGAAMALVYQRTGSVWGAYFAHSAFNLTTVMLYGFALGGV